jgi:4-phosphopantoate--beta-alanine ligase
MGENGHKIPKSHPRYLSLQYREKIVEGLKAGLISEAGLIAHGRGEAFDYLIGEKTLPEAMEAEKAGVATLLMARRPVVSVNGNVAALAPDKIVDFAKAIGAKIEVNLFYRSDERVDRIVEHLRRHGAEEVLGRKGDRLLPIESERRRVDIGGIYSSDAVFLALEDGDRTEALVRMNKKVVAVDLNPLSRTAQMASITIVDELSRALENMIGLVASLDEPEAIVKRYDNGKTLNDIILRISDRLKELGGKGKDKG